MRAWHELMNIILQEGEERLDRTGVGTIALFGTSICIDISQGFPAVTTKKLQFKSVAAELAGFLEGTTSLARMQELGTNIWNKNAEANGGELGRIYGAVWRNLNGVDQLANVVKGLTTDPTSRRHFVTAWEVPSDACLPACHTNFQFYVSNQGYLQCCVYMRSVDVFLGLPFDIASYALLMHIVCNQVNLLPSNLIFVFGDTHIYKNHLEQVKTVLNREYLDPPKLWLNQHATIDNFTPDMASLIGYRFHTPVPADMAV